jgi:hypothetical protein
MAHTKKAETPDDAPPKDPYVIATALNMSDLQITVIGYMRDGYKCQGGVCCEGEEGAIHQAMVLDS